MIMNPRWLAGVLFVVLLAPSLARADEGEAQPIAAPEPLPTPLLTPAPPPTGQRPRTGHRHGFLGDALFLSVGGSAAVTGHKKADTGATFGGEVSVVRLTESGVWFGGYMDARYDLTAEEGRVSFGPEVGFAFFGIDAGIYRRIGPGPDQWGMQVRPMITTGIFTLYGAYGSTVGASTTNFYEAGILLKVPIQLQHYHAEAEEIPQPKREATELRGRR
jgi:hypothetical protein